MQSGFFLSPARCAALLMACCSAALAAAQTPPATTNNDWLTQTAKMYYSSSKAGLKGFDCALKPNWEAVFAAKSGLQLSATDASSVALLNSVKTAIHARMDSGTTVDWNPPTQQLDATQTALLSQMHDGMNQMVQGFMQFWTPFIEDQVVPDSADGLDMTATADGGKQIHVSAGQVDVAETFDNSHMLREYDVTMTGTKVLLTPTYSPSDHGLVVTHFHAVIEAGSDATKNQEMNVDVTYQWLEGFPVPAQLIMEVVGVASLNIAFEGCTVQH